MIVALDLDGTLLTCAPRHCAVARYGLAATASSRQTEFDASCFWELKRNGSTTQEALLHVGKDRSRMVSDIWREEIEKTHWLSFDSLLPGIEDMLSEIRRSGAELALVSARQDAAAARCQMTRLGLLGSFETVRFVPQCDVAAGKARVLSELGAVLYIGDTETDYTAAATADVPCRLVDTGMRNKKYLEGSLPVSVFSSLLDAFYDGLDFRNQTAG
ncbi:MAG: HAD family hydrolase [Dokdonella sp.]